MNVREKNVFHSMFLVVCVLTALCSQDNVFVLSQHVEESLPHNSRDLIMREDGQEMFYNVDIDKYQEGGTYFNEETNMNEDKTMDRGTLLKHPDNRPMENSNPSFIGPKAHAYWTRHQSKVEHESEEEENQGQEEDYDQIADQCLHLPDPGPCRASFKRFYFNKATFECYPFIYGGCLGNHNNFESIEDCHLTCLKHD
ncbi:amyloid-beta A4 protein-like isoform X2 [Biomphalaria glabrata]|uniref:Amyloid-beta A4 protein-like isoform X2 n=1 Tax=Biomphalaria glabrata TaxID=6526 RepID=A0A9W3B2U8_BIOGL|nr:amyloid-beta A4 protein-like isoform X2 [Biomphalaria glabrata]